MEPREMSVHICIEPLFRGAGSGDATAGEALGNSATILRTK
jgi:hypothetical protein